MRTFLRNNAVFIALSLILVIVLGLAIIYIPQGDLHLLLCDRHTPARDIFYRYYTHVAEWFPYVLCVFLLLFSRVGDGVFASAAMLMTTLTTQILKHVFSAPRPLSWFGLFMPDVQLPLVEGVQMNYWYSFPSGHTTSFFALAFVACIIIGARRQEAEIKTKMPQPLYSFLSSVLIPCLLFVLAALGGYSRIYLSQHFARDVFAGILVGTLITVVCYAIFHRFEDKKWYNYRVFAKKCT